VCPCAVPVPLLPGVGMLVSICPLVSVCLHLQKGVIRGSWFFLHRGVQLLAVLLSLAGFILALVAFKVGWSLSDPTPHPLYDSHRFLGVVVMAFVLFQVRCVLCWQQCAVSKEPGLMRLAACRRGGGKPADLGAACCAWGSVCVVMCLLLLY